MKHAITTRAAAKVAGHHKYFTGKPCAHGHVAERYTQSGTCSACIAASNKAAAFSVPNNREAHRHAVAELMEIKVRAYPHEIGRIAAAAHVLAGMRNNLVQFDDVRIPKPPTKGAGGTVLYKLRVHPADLETIEEMARRLLAAHVVDIGAERERVFRIGQQFAAEAACPVPQFRP